MKSRILVVLMMMVTLLLVFPASRLKLISARSVSRAAEWIRRPREPGTVR
jgi:hypothetical protein